MLPTTYIIMHFFSVTLTPPPLSLSLSPPSLTLSLSVVAAVVFFMVFYNNNNKNVFLYFYVSCCLDLVWFWFLFDRSTYRIVCLLACLIGQLLYLALFYCSLFARPIGCFLYFYCLFTSLPLGCHCFSVLPLLSHVLPAVYIHVSACVCSYSPPLPPPLSLSLPLVCLSVGLSACLSACLSVCLSVCLSACLSVSPFLSPTPTAPLFLSLPLFVPLFLYFHPSFPLCSVSPLRFICLFVCFVFICFVLVLCGCFVLFSLLFFFHWILNTSRARFKRM